MRLPIMNFSVKRFHQLVVCKVPSILLAELIRRGKGTELMLEKIEPENEIKWTIVLNILSIQKGVTARVNTMCCDKGQAS